MGFHRKQQSLNLDPVVFEFADLITNISWSKNTEKVLDISEYPEKLFRLYYSNTVHETIKKGETKSFSWKFGAILHNITLTATDTSITFLSDNSYSGFIKLQGYRAIYYDYPTEEVATATTALYTLDEAADVIAQEVKANE